MARSILLIFTCMILTIVSSPTLAEVSLEGRWEGLQGGRVLITLVLNNHGSGIAEFRRKGVDKVGKATISDLVVSGNDVTYTQYYTDAIEKRVTGTTANIRLFLSPDQKRMVGRGTNLENGNSFDVQLVKK